MAFILRASSFVLLTVFIASARAEQIPLKVIDGRPCFRAVLQCGTQTVEAHVVLDLGTQAPVLLHEKAAKALRLQPGSKLTILVEGMSPKTLADLSVTAMKIPLLDAMTQNFAAELSEVPAVAVVGLPAFSEFVPQLDLPRNRLALLTNEEAAELDKSVPYVTSFEIASNRLLFGVIGPKGKKLRVQFQSLQHDTLIDQTMAKELGAANGAVNPLYLDTNGNADEAEGEGEKESESAGDAEKLSSKDRLNFGKFVVFRPAKLPSAKPPIDLVLGTHLLSHFRVTIDVNRKRLFWEQAKPPLYPITDRHYFAAMVNEDAGELEKCLSKYSHSRLAEGAAKKLLSLRLAEYPSDRERLTKAIQFLVTSTQQKRRASMLLALADKWIVSDRADRNVLASIALESALQFARQDIDATASHRIQARLGRLAYQDKDYRVARRRLLSAAFGLPHDEQVNLWLGELYEATQKPVRAWSRYLQSTLGKRPPMEAFVGLGRLNRDPAFRDQFSMRDAAELLEGRTPAFHPKRHYVQDQKEFPHHIKLVELFTNIFDKKTNAAEASLDAIGEYFDVDTADEPVALLEYHIKTSVPDPLVVPFSQARAKFYQVAGVPTALFEGGQATRAAGVQEDSSDVFDIYTPHLRSTEKKTPSACVTLSGQVQRVKRQLTGQVTVDASTLVGDKKSSDLEKVALHVVICESLVMSPGGNGRVLHRFVVRGSLTPDEGLSLASKVTPDKASFVFDIKLDTESFSETLLEQMNELEKINSQALIIKPNYVDAREVLLVAFVQDTATKEILGVKVIRPSETSSVQTPKAGDSEEKPVTSDGANVGKSEKKPVASGGADKEVTP